MAREEVVSRLENKQEVEQQTLVQTAAAAAEMAEGRRQLVVVMRLEASEIETCGTRRAPLRNLV